MSSLICIDNLTYFDGLKNSKIGYLKQKKYQDIKINNGILHIQNYEKGYLFPDKIENIKVADKTKKYLVE